MSKRTRPKTAAQAAHRRRRHEYRTALAQAKKEAAAGTRPAAATPKPAKPAAAATPPKPAAAATPPKPAAPPTPQKT